MIIENLIYEMRLLGVRRLSIELEPATNAELARPTEPVTGLDTESPAEELKSDELCSEPGCSEPKGGIFGGTASHLCRNHAMASAGVRFT